MTPGPWEFALLALAAYRLWRLLAEDDLTASLRARLLWQKETSKAPKPTWAFHFVSCPWCLGAWVAAGWWAAWWAWSDTLVVAAPFAISAAVGVAAVVVDRLSE